MPSFHIANLRLEEIIYWLYVQERDLILL